MIKKLSPFIGIIVLLIFLSKINFNDLENTLLQINFLYFAVSLSLIIPLLIIKSYRWNYAKKQHQIYYPLKDSILMFGAASFIGVITPGRIGDLSRVFYLVRDGYSTGKSIVASVFPRLFELAFYLVAGAIGIIFFFSISDRYIISIILIIAGILLLLMSLVSNKFIGFILNKIFLKIIPLRYQQTWQLNVRDFTDGLKVYRLKNIFIIFSITLCGWLVYCLQAFCIGKSLGLGISFWYIAGTISLVQVVNLLPISIMGLGTRDAVLIFTFSLIDISSEIAIGFSVLLLALLTVSIMVVFVCWLLKPLSIKLS